MGGRRVWWLEQKPACQDTWVLSLALLLGPCMSKSLPLCRTRPLLLPTRLLARQRCSLPPSPGPVTQLPRDKPGVLWKLPPPGVRAQPGSGSCQTPPARHTGLQFSKGQGPGGPQAMAGGCVCVQEREQDAGWGGTPPPWWGLFPSPAVSPLLGHRGCAHTHPLTSPHCGLSTKGKWGNDPTPAAVHMGIHAARGHRALTPPLPHKATLPRHLSCRRIPTPR